MNVFYIISNVLKQKRIEFLYFVVLPDESNNDFDK